MLRVSLRNLVPHFNFATSAKAKQKIQDLFGQTQLVNRQTIISLDKQRFKNYKQVEQYNSKVKNYHYYQYFRGQDFIENIPYSDNMKYTIKDSHAEQEEKERVTIEELQPVSQHITRANMIREKINAYHQKQKKYQIQEFQKYLRHYPGTVKGPNPQDDPQAYRNYAMKKIPRVLLEQLAMQEADKKEREDFNKDQDNDRGQQARLDSPTSFHSNLGQDRILLDPEISSKEEQNAWFQKFRQGWQHQQLMEDYKMDVPLMPSLNFQNYQHFINHWMGWLSFRNSYTEHNLQINMKNYGQQMERLCDSFIQTEADQWTQLEANIPSLYRYYKCLPQSLQDHPGMKDIYKGLEYLSPDFSYEEKENALNYTCTLLLPFDDISTKILTDYGANSRHKFTQYLHEKVSTISPQFTWDLASFLEQIRKQELRGQTSNQNKDLRYPQPPEVHKMWEEGAPNLPVDFYDNEDGFWDPIISEKLRRYDQHKPMLKTRKHFTH